MAEFAEKEPKKVEELNDVSFPPFERPLSSMLIAPHQCNLFFFFSTEQDDSDDDVPDLVEGGNADAAAEEEVSCASV
jgi:UDP-glucose 6-dehydrogenase